MPLAVPENILLALENVYKDNVEAYGRVVFFFDSCADGEGEQYVKSLERVIDKPAFFKSVADRLAEDTKSVEKDSVFRQIMYDIWKTYMKEDDKRQDGHGQCMKLALTETQTAVANQNLLRSLALMSPTYLTALQTFIKTKCGEGIIVKLSNMALTGARSCSKSMVKVGLVAAFLAYDVIKNMIRWWKGEITGKRCCKNIIDSGVGIAAGLAGGLGGEMAGVAIGAAVAGPIGAAVGAISGAVLGGLVASISAQALSDFLTQKIFGIPKSEALENAYVFFDLKSSASNNEINTRYHKMSLVHHPDRPTGNREKWTQLQYSLQVIRQARGEY